MDRQELRLLIKEDECRRWLDVGDVRPKMQALSPKELRRWEPSSSNETKQTNEDRLCIIYRDILMTGECWKYGKMLDEWMFDKATAEMLKMQTFSTMPYPFTLAVGEGWERAMEWHLTALGVPCRRYAQTGIPSQRLRAYQRDLSVRSVDGKIWNIELKALRDASHSHDGVLVGDVGKWDEKRFPVAICLIVHQETGAISWAEADDKARQGWRRERNKYGSSYLVPNECWEPLETLVTALGYML